MMPLNVSFPATRRKSLVLVKDGNSRVEVCGGWWKYHLGKLFDLFGQFPT